MPQAPHYNLRTFIEALRTENELAHVTSEVNTHLEVAEIHRRVIEEQGPALLFTNPKGAAFPLVTNLFGTKKRVEMAFGSHPEKLIEQIARAPERLVPPTLKKIWDHRDLIWSLLKTGLSSKRSAPITEQCMTPAKLTKLPMLTTWPEDGGAFVTLPLVYTEHPETGVHNLGMYRLHRYDDGHTGFHAQIGKGGGFHLSVARKLNKKLPVNVFLGGPPALILSAIAPLPENVPELLFASLVQGARLGLVHNHGTELPLIGEAEFALCGHVDPHEMRPEGPFGDHYGYYSLQHDYPVFTVDKIFHRKDAIYPATVVGMPRQEDYFIGNYLQKLLSPLFPLVMPTVSDLWSYGETGFHALSAAVVKQRYKREALVAGFRILGEGQLSLTKFLLLVDKPMDLTKFRDVLTYILERADFRTDLFIFSNLSMDTLDYTGPKVNEGSKGLLLGAGDPIRFLPRVFENNPDSSSAIRKAIAFCPGCLVIEGASYEQDTLLAKTVTSLKGIADWPLVILCDDAVAATQSEAAFLWHVFLRFEPGADIYSGDPKIVRNHVAHTGPIVIDARVKPWYPGVVECDSATRELVDARWSEYWGR